MTGNRVAGWAVMIVAAWMLIGGLVAHEAKVLGNSAANAISEVLR